MSSRRGRERGDRAAHLGQNGKAERMTDWRLQAFRAAGRRWRSPAGRAPLSRSTTSRTVPITPSPRAWPKPKSLDGVDPKHLATYAGHPAQGADGLYWQRRDRPRRPRRAARSPSIPSSTASLGTTLGGAEEGGRHRCSISTRRSGSIPARARKCSAVSCRSRTTSFASTSNSAVFSDRSPSPHPPNTRALDELSTCSASTPRTPGQFEHADRRQGVLRQLSGGLHRAQARHGTVAARRW